VIEEIDQHPDINQRHPQRDRYRQMRDEVTMRAAVHRYQRDHREAERSHKRPQRQLGAQVAHEISQHPRPELSGSQCQRHDVGYGEKH